MGFSGSSEVNDSMCFVFCIIVGKKRMTHSDHCTSWSVYLCNGYVTKY